MQLTHAAEERRLWVKRRRLDSAPIARPPQSRRYGLHRVRRFRDDAVGRIGRMEVLPAGPLFLWGTRGGAGPPFILAASGVVCFGGRHCGLLF